MNGATAQADVLGIFGREGLDMATRWTTPSPGSPAYDAIKLYRNYDGSGSAFGHTSVAPVAPNPDNLAAFGALRSSDGALTIMAVHNVLAGHTPATFALAGFFAAGPVQVWRRAAGAPIARLADLAVSGNAFTATLPPQSLTLFVLPVTDAIFRDGF